MLEQVEQGRDGSGNTARNKFDEVSLQLNSANDTAPVHSVVTDWLAHGMKDAEDAPALQFGNVKLSHREFDQLSNKIANYLIRKGVKRGDRVGMSLDRSIEMIAALIGILKAGAAYVPLDPDYPSERLAMMKEDAGLRLLLVHSHHVDRFDKDSEPLLVWEQIEEAINRELSVPTGVKIDPEDIAYVIFTSGSTGRPKGIAMPHRALSNLIEWQLERRSFKSAARVLQYSSISFDVSFQEIATTISSGGVLFLIGNNDRKDPRALLRQLIEQRIERLFLPYVAMRSVIEAALVVGETPDSLKETITAGEQLHVDDAVRAFFRKIDKATLDNQYGPSETHVITAHLLEGDPQSWPDIPPIGTPLANTSVYILDEMMHPVGVGEEGELYLAGRNLAHGYLHREEITLKSFIPNPHGIPHRPILYKTGDLGAYNEDGSINFLGRKDHQVKIRGHRVEPGEVNTAAARFPGIAHCLTHVVVGSGGIAQLGTYYVVQQETTVEPTVLRQHLSNALPDYMVPAFLIQIDDIPYTPSGKVDLKALPRPCIENSQYAGEENRYESETEVSLARIWSELLDMDGIPRTADFFELGGDSLRAVTLFLKIQQQFDKDLPLATLTQSPTIALLARVIEGRSEASNLNGFRSLQIIQPGDESRIPFFLIHGGAGNVLIFKDFARNLGLQQPVYGFQWSGWDGCRGETSILEMASAYKEELLRFRPHGPCRIGGNCIGGLIAIELVHQLRKEGVVVEDPIIVWDAPNLQSRNYRPEEPWDSVEAIESLENLKAELLRTTVSSNAPKCENRQPSPSPGLVGLLKRIPYLHPLIRRVKVFAKSIPIQYALRTGGVVPVALRPFYCLQTMLSAVKNHTCSGYDGDMIYFRSHCVLGQGFGFPGWWEDHFLGFSELCRGRFEGHVMGGDHNDVLKIPEVGEIVKRYYKEID